MWWRKNDDISDHLNYKAGIIFLEFETAEEMIEKTKNINQLIMHSYLQSFVT
jgi:hypothetical protein